MQMRKGIISNFFSPPPKLHLQAVKLSEFLAHIGTLFTAQTEAKGVRFTVSHPKDTMVSIDPVQMTHAMLNILQNALEATPPNGSIALDCSVSNLQDRGSDFPLHDRLLSFMAG